MQISDGIRQHNGTRKAGRRITIACPSFPLSGNRLNNRRTIENLYSGLSAQSLPPSISTIVYSHLSATYPTLALLQDKTTHCHTEPHSAVYASQRLVRARKLPPSFHLLPCKENEALHCERQTTLLYWEGEEKKTTEPSCDVIIKRRVLCVMQPLHHRGLAVLWHPQPWYESRTRADVTDLS